MTKIIKLTDENLEMLKSLGIEGLTENDVKPELIRRLKEVDVEDMQDDPIDDLIMILMAFEEIETPALKNKKVVTQQKSGSETKSKKKVESKKSKKVVDSSKITKSFVNLFEDEEQKALITETFVKPFKERGYNVVYGKKIISFRLPATISGRCVFTIDDIRLSSDGKATVFLGLNAFRLVKTEGNGLESCRELLHEDYKDALGVYINSGLLYINHVTIQDVKRILTTELLDYMESRISKLEKKLGTNRKKMEESIEE